MRESLSKYVVGHAFPVTLTLAALFLGDGLASAVSPTTREMQTAKRFVAEKLLSTDPARLPFSFVYGGKSTSSGVTKARSWP